MNGAYLAFTELTPRSASVFADWPDGDQPFHVLWVIRVDYQTALIDAKPIALVPGVSVDVPDHRVMACSQSRSRSRIPEYGPSAVLFDHIAGSIPWFGIFSRASGCVLQFHYPDTAEKGERIQVIYNADQIIPNGCIEWVHGILGLAEGRCFDVMVLWPISLARRQQSKGRGAASIHCM